MAKKVGLVLLALAVFIGIAVASEALGAKDGIRAAFRIAAAGIIVLSAVQWVRAKLQQHRDEAARRAGQWPDYRPYADR